MTIPLMRDTFAHEAETRAALVEWLSSGPVRLSMGEQCAAFEREFAAWQGRKYAVLFNSGGSANLALLQALRNLDEHKQKWNIGFSALTWATNVMPILQMGYRPVPVDVDPCTFNVMSGTLEKHLPNLKALFITNALGYLPDLDRIRDMCKRAGVLLLEDNCESLGSELLSGKAGNFGAASTFSFFVAHHMSTIEGGMVCTDSEGLANMLRMVRANGWDRNLSFTEQTRLRTVHRVSEFDAAYTFYVSGFNLRPTEITGFLGRQQLKHIDEALTIRSQYFDELEDVARRNYDFEVLNHSHQTRLSPFAFPVLCRTPEQRSKYVKLFCEAGVEIRPVIAGNITRQPFYRAAMGPAIDPLRGADRVEECGFYFGIYPELTRAELDTLKACLRGDYAA